MREKVRYPRKYQRGIGFFYANFAVLRDFLKKSNDFKNQLYVAFGLESEETSVYSKNRNSSGGNMKLVKAIGGLLAMVLTISAAACNGGTRNEEKSELPLTSAYGIGDQDLLYGMCYPSRGKGLRRRLRYGGGS